MAKTNKLLSGIATAPAHATTTTYENTWTSTNGQATVADPFNKSDVAPS